jgi:hypothetical protein
MTKLPNDDGSETADGRRPPGQLPYGDPSEAEVTDDGAEAATPDPQEDDTKRAAENYRQDLRQRYGPGVPEREIEAFAAVFPVARWYAEHTEAMHTALRAGASEGQRRKAVSQNRAADGAGGGS